MAHDCALDEAFSDIITIIRKEKGTYQRAEWDIFSDDIIDQTDYTVALIAHIIESYKPPLLPVLSSPEVAAAGAA